MKNWKKVAIAGISLLAAATLAACSSNSGTSTSSSSNVSGSVKLYVDPAQQKSFQSVVDGFTKANPNVKVQVIANASGSANAKTDIAKDPSKYADVFAVPNDQLGDMVAKGYINPLSPDATKTVTADNSTVAVNGMSYKGKLYAYPSEIQAQVIFYNKSKLTADDVKTWAGLTAKGVLATDFTNAYNFFPVFFSAGAQLFGSNGEDVAGSTLNTANGIAAMTWFAAQKANPNVMQTTNALNQLQSGKADAIIDGPWDTANIKKILGNNYAVAQFPTINLNGQDKQLQSFLGIHGFAVNSYAKDQKASQALAQYITSQAAQMVLFKNVGLVPSNKNAQADSTVKADATTKAILQMSQNGYSTLMPKLPQMAVFWNNAAPLINGAYSGTIPADQFQAKLDAFQASISK